MTEPMPAPFLEIPMDSALPVIRGFEVDADLLPLEGGSDPAFGTVRWKTLICADKTPSSDMVLGIAHFGAGDTLEPHSHTPAEFYLGLSGSGTVMLDGTPRSIRAGIAIYIPSNSEHGVVAGPEGLSFAYGFPNSRFADVDYRFLPKAVG